MLEKPVNLISLSSCHLIISNHLLISELAMVLIMISKFYDLFCYL